MSVEYYVKLGLFKIAGIQDIMDGFVRRDRDLEHNAAEDMRSCHFFKRGSIRGVTLSNDSGDKRSFVVRTNHMSSEIDGEITFELLRFLMETYRAKVEHESGYEISERHLSRDQILDQVVGNRQDRLLEALLKEDDHLTLPVWDSTIVLYKADYEYLKSAEGYPGTLYRYLQNKVWRVLHARKASRMKLQTGTIITVWAYDDMITYETDMVSLDNPQQEDAKIFVRWAQFIKCQEVRSERIPMGRDQSYCLFIAGVKNETAVRIYQELKEFAVPIESL